MKQNKSFGIITIIFVLWFILSIFGGIYFVNIGEAIGVALFGQYFLIFGLLMFFGSKQKIGIIFALIGLFVLVWIGVVAFGINIPVNEDLIGFVKEKFLPWFGVSMFPLIGMCMMIIPMRFENKKRHRCSVAVEAKCVRLKKTHSIRTNSDIWNYNDYEIYSPVWNYYVAGKTYTYCDNCYSRVSSAEVGDVCTLYVNPDNFNDVYSKNEFRVFRVIELVGIMFVLGGGVFVYAMLKSVLFC